jgi:hypothetical protein
MAKPDVVRSTTALVLPIEDSFSKAIKGRKVFGLEDGELKPLMLYIYALIGLRGENYPNGLDKDFIHTYLRENYGGHTSEEIRLAFTMAIQGKLNIDPRDVKCYEHFNVNYLTSIMEAYREWAREEIKRVPEKKALPSPEKWQIELEYAHYILTTIDKLPCQILP